MRACSRASAARWMLTRMSARPRSNERHRAASGADAASSRRRVRTWLRATGVSHGASPPSRMLSSPHARAGAMGLPGRRV